MKEIPISFNSEQVQAILDGRKTQTRRAIKWLKGWKDFICHHVIPLDFGLFSFWGKDSSSYDMMSPCRVGDRLWVKENYLINWWCASGVIKGFYASDNTEFEIQLSSKEQYKFEKRKYPSRQTSGRFMYKSLARIWLEITGVRVEQNKDGVWEWVLEFKRIKP